MVFCSTCADFCKFRIMILTNRKKWSKFADSFSHPGHTKDIEPGVVMRGVDSQWII